MFTLSTKLKVVFKYCGVIRTLTVSNGRSDEHSKSAELEGKEIKVVTSSLRVDAVAARGLNISRKTLWEIALEGCLMLNGVHVNKKSTEVSEGDIVEVDTLLKTNNRTCQSRNENRLNQHISDDSVIKRGRVVVKEIGSRTHKGGYHLTLLRYKQYAIITRT